MIRVAATLAIAVVLTGCNPGVDSFSIHRFSASTENEFEALDRTVTDATLASRLYQDIRELRPQPAGTYFCGLDFSFRNLQVCGCFWVHQSISNLYALPHALPTIAR